MSILSAAIEKGGELRVERGVCSLKEATTSSQVTSGRMRYREGDLGFLLDNRKPLCLNVTMSPAFGFHLFTNSDVPAGAANVTPLGLIGIFKKGAY